MSNSLCYTFPKEYQSAFEKSFPQSPTKCVVYLAESLFQTRFRKGAITI
ncbi:DUF6783 domain-containing protein [Blautia glucerasea]